MSEVLRREKKIAEIKQDVPQIKGEAEMGNAKKYTHQVNPDSFGPLPHCTDQGY